jgi:geranylgeranyl reductase family protein
MDTESPEYDAIVIGAGPGGGECARELSAVGYKVLLLERSKIIGEPNFSSGNILKDTLGEFKLSKKIIQTKWNSLAIISKNQKAEFYFKDTIGYIIDYKALKRFLADEAKRNGAVLMVGTAAEAPIMEEGKLKGVKFTNGKAKAKVIIDASGPYGILSAKFGILKERTSGMAGVEYLMSNVTFENGRKPQFYLGKSFIPKGYAWIFPTKKSEAKVGVAIWTQNKGVQRKALDKFVASNSQTKHAKILDIHGGRVAFANPKTFVQGNLIAIGDAAGQCNPLGGEGIEYALRAGRYAAMACIKYMQSDRKDIGLLKDYDKLWKKHIGKRWALSYVMADRVYPKLSDKNADRLVRLYKRMAPDDIIDLLYRYKFQKLGKYIIKI